MIEVKRIPNDSDCAICDAEAEAIAERNENALAYIRKCERRRQRKARRRQRRIDRFMRSATPFAGGICVLWFILALV